MVKRRQIVIALGAGALLMPLAALPLALDSRLCHTLRMRVVGNSRIPGPQLMPSAQGLVAARAHQNAGLALAAVRTTGIPHGIYRFASHEEMNRATEEALVGAIRLNARARDAVAGLKHDR